jgi:hypothetical protein
MEQDVSEGAGPVVSKMKGGATGAPEGDSRSYAEITIPDGVDGDEYREGFESAVAAYVEALEIGGDVEYSEDEDESASFAQGVRAGLEYAMDFAARVEDDGKMKDLKAPPAKGMSDLPAEEGDLPAGEGGGEDGTEEDGEAGGGGGGDAVYRRPAGVRMRGRVDLEGQVGYGYRSRHHRRGGG